MAKKPTHICIDCGAVGYAGGYHDHGDGNAGDTASIAAVLEGLRKGGEARDALALIREALAQVTPDQSDTGPEAFVAHVAGIVDEVSA